MTPIPSPLKAVLKRWRLRARGLSWRVIRAARETVTIITQQGVFTVSTRDDGIAATLYRQKHYEMYSATAALELLRSRGFLAREDVTMLDVGANFGVISIGLVGNGHVARAVAIEPEPFNFDLLEKNVAQNGLSAQFINLSMAVGDTRSTLVMELSPDNLGDHRIRTGTPKGDRERQGESARETIEVPILTLPQILELPEVHDAKGFSSPSLLWIDVQGFEGYVFRGAIQLLKGMPAVSEVWPYGILRSGMQLDEYCDIVSSIWTEYWVENRLKFTRHSMTEFPSYVEEVERGGRHANVIFTTAG
jgi:FkbM family methyltransferase